MNDQRFFINQKLNLANQQGRKDRYAALMQHISPGVRRYNVFWHTYESSGVVSSYDVGLTCPTGYLKVGRCVRVHVRARARACACGVRARACASARDHSSESLSDNSLAFDKQRPSIVASLLPTLHSRCPRPLPTSPPPWPLKRCS